MTRSALAPHDVNHVRTGVAVDRGLDGDAKSTAEEASARETKRACDNLETAPDARRGTTSTVAVDNVAQRPGYGDLKESLRVEEGGEERHPAYGTEKCATRRSTIHSS